MQKELIKPEKPGHFVRDHIVIYIVGFACFGLGLYLDFTFSFLVLIVIIVGVPAWRFRQYNAERVAYTRAYYINKFERESSPSNADVNANIERYKEKQKRQNAHWWQFWRY